MPTSRTVSSSFLPTRDLPPLRPVPLSSQISAALGRLETALGIGSEQVVRFDIQEQADASPSGQYGESSDGLHLEEGSESGIDDLESRYAHSWLTRVVGIETDDVTMQDRAAALLASLCGRPASSQMITRFCFGPVSVRIKDSPVTADALGNRTWGAAPLLARRLISDCLSSIADATPSHPRTVLELGAGTGLVGLTLNEAQRAEYGLQPASSLEAVHLTDHHPHVLETLSGNVGLNGHDTSPSRGRVRVARLDWQEVHRRAQVKGAAAADAHYHSTAQTLPEESHNLRSIVWPHIPDTAKYDIVIAADCIYDAIHPVWIRSVAEEHLIRPAAYAVGSSLLQAGTLLLICPLRKTHVAEMEAIYTAFPRLSDLAEVETALSGARLCIVWETDEIGYDDFGPLTLSHRQESKSLGLRTIYRTFAIRWRQ